jgi:hypothetical protein
MIGIISICQIALSNWCHSHRLMFMLNSVSDLIEPHYIDEKNLMPLWQIRKVAADHNKKGMYEASNINHRLWTMGKFSCMV